MTHNVLQNYAITEQKSQKEEQTLVLDSEFNKTRYFANTESMIKLLKTNSDSEQLSNESIDANITPIQALDQISKFFNLYFFHLNQTRLPLSKSTSPLGTSLSKMKPFEMSSQNQYYRQSPTNDQSEQLTLKNAERGSRMLGNLEGIDLETPENSTLESGNHASQPSRKTIFAYLTCKDTLTSQFTNCLIGICSHIFISLNNFCLGLEYAQHKQRNQGQHCRGHRQLFYFVCYNKVLWSSNTTCYLFAFQRLIYKFW